MTKNVIIVIAVLILALVIGAVVEVVRQPVPVSWHPSYISYDKEPYGTYVFFSELKNLFPGNEVRRLRNSDLDQYSYVNNYILDEYDSLSPDNIFRYLDDDLDYTSFNIIWLAGGCEVGGAGEWQIFTHLASGGNALVSATYLDPLLENTLGIETETMSVNTYHKDSINKAFTIKLNDEVWEIPPSQPPSLSMTYITSYPDSSEVIATNGFGEVIGIKVQYRKGTLIYFSLPLIFTNYYLLKKDKGAAEELLTMLPNQKTYWTTSLIGQQARPQSRSLLSFIHSQPSLTWAFYTLIFSTIVFLLFQTKRMQRAIPVITPPENTTIKFAEIISNLYQREKNYKKIAQKKMTYFLEEVRNKYNLDTKVQDEKFMKLLAMKSGVNERHVKRLFFLYGKIQDYGNIATSDLENINEIFQKFK